MIAKKLRASQPPAVATWARALGAQGVNSRQQAAALVKMADLPLAEGARYGFSEGRRATACDRSFDRNEQHALHSDTTQRTPHAHVGPSN
jgi:hypothetical protein